MMDETNEPTNRNVPNTAVIAIAIAIVAIGVLVFKTKPNADMAQLPEPSTSGIAQPVGKAASAATAPQEGDGATTGMVRSTAAFDSRSSGGMAQQPGSFNEPRQYQPNNPYPDYRRTVTSSDAGIGASNGAK